jgi:hypothetical protein
LKGLIGWILVGTVTGGLPTAATPRGRFGFFIFLPVLIGVYRNDFRTHKSAPTCEDGTEAGFGLHFLAAISCDCFALRRGFQC